MSDFILKGYPQSFTSYIELCKSLFTYSVTITNEKGLAHCRAHRPLQNCVNVLRTKAEKLKGLPKFKN